MKSKIKKTTTRSIIGKVALVAAICLIVMVCGFLAMSQNIRVPQTSGVTFSRTYTEYLRLDPGQVLTAALDDLKIRRFRIPAYWNLIQPEKDQWDWSWLDEDLNKIAERQGTVILVVGQKQPRWPECWIPHWVTQLDRQDRDQALLTYITEVVKRYKHHPAVSSWQLENEANFAFGECPAGDLKFFDEEIKAVRAADDTRKPIATTESGELSSWLLGSKVDRLGISVYRIVSSSYGLFRYWFVPPQLYLRKAQFLRLFGRPKDIYISEFQMEPWTKESILNTPVEIQMKSFDLRQMNKNIKFARNSGFSTVDYWGLEWWYWMKTVRDKPEFWEAARAIFQ